LQTVEETDLKIENRRISNFQGPVTLTSDGVT